MGSLPPLLGCSSGGLANWSVVELVHVWILPSLPWVPHGATALCPGLERFLQYAGCLWHSRLPAHWHSKAFPHTIPPALPPNPSSSLLVTRLQWRRGGSSWFFWSKPLESPTRIIHLYRPALSFPLLLYLASHCLAPLEGLGESAIPLGTPSLLCVSANSWDSGLFLDPPHPSPNTNSLCLCPFSKTTDVYGIPGNGRPASFLAPDVSPPSRGPLPWWSKVFITYIRVIGYG